MWQAEVAEVLCESAGVTALAVLGELAALWRQPGERGRHLCGELTAELLPAPDLHQRQCVPDPAAVSGSRLDGGVNNTHHRVTLPRRSWSDHSVSGSYQDFHGIIHCGWHRAEEVCKWGMPERLAPCCNSPCGRLCRGCHAPSSVKGWPHIASMSDAPISMHTWPSWRPWPHRSFKVGVRHHGHVFQINPVLIQQAMFLLSVNCQQARLTAAREAARFNACTFLSEECEACAIGMFQKCGSRGSLTVV